MSNNIVSFKYGLDKKTLANVKFFVDILESQNHSDCTIFRMSIFPTYHKLDENQRYMLDGIFVGMLYQLKDQLDNLEVNDDFRKSDFSELLEVAIKDSTGNSPFSLTVPFRTSALTVVIVPTLGRYIVTEFYVDSVSGVQRAFELYAKTSNVTVEEIWGVEDIWG